MPQIWLGAITYEFSFGIDEYEKTKTTPTRLITKDKADNTLEGLLDDTAEYGLISDYGTLLYSFEHIHIFKHVDYYTHSLYSEASQIKYASNIKVYYRVRDNEPWILFESEFETAKAYPTLNRFVFGSSGLKAKHLKFEAPDAILLGMFRLYAISEFKSVPTKTGSIKDSFSKKYKDLKSLEEHYAKIISENYPPVTEGRGPLIKINNDMSKFVPIQIEGDSSIEIISPETDSNMTLENRKWHVDVRYMEPFESRVGITLRDLKFANHSSKAVSIVSMNLEYLDFDGVTWIPLSDTKAAYWKPDLNLSIKKEFAYDAEDTYKLKLKEDKYNGQYIYTKTLDVLPGEITENHLVEGHLEAPVKPFATYSGARTIIPVDMPYPLTVRYSFTDSEKKHRSYKIVYMVDVPDHSQTVEQVKKEHNLQSTDYLDECHDVINRIQNFLGVRMSSDKREIEMCFFGVVKYFNHQATKINETKGLNLIDLRFKLESQQKKEQAL